MYVKVSTCPRLRNRAAQLFAEKCPVLIYVYSLKGEAEVAKGVLRSVRDYSEAMKLEVVNEVSSGRRSLCEAIRHYEVPRSTLSGWLAKYGEIKRNPSRPEVLMMGKESDKERELKSALADAHLKIKLYEQMFDFAKEDYGLEIKKNTTTGQHELVRNEKKQR